MTPNGFAAQTWFALDGSVPAGRETAFPDEMAQRVIAALCPPAGWVLDPFAGFGTTLAAAQLLGRRAIGFEIDPARQDVARQGLRPPSRLIAASAEQMADHDLPPVDLVLTSPPYCTVNLDDDPMGPGYFSFLDRVFRVVARVTRPGAPIIVEVSDIMTEDGFRPLAGQVMQVLGRFLWPMGILARCNTGSTPAGPGVNHSSLLYFHNTEPDLAAGTRMGDWT